MEDQARMSGDRFDPDLERRVDSLFAEAIEQQVGEQRAIAQALVRVDDSLDTLHGALTDLAARVDAAAAPAARLEAALETRLAAAGDAVTAGGAQIAEVTARLHGLVDQMEQVHSRTADSAEQGVARLHAAIGSAQSAAAADADRLREATSATRSELLAVVEESARRLAAVAEETAASGTDRVVAAADAVGARLAELHGGGVERLDEAAAGLVDVAREVAVNAETRLAGVTDRLTGVAERLDVFGEVERARADAANEALAGLRAGLRQDAEAILADLQQRGEVMLERIGRRADDVLEAVTAAESSLRASLADAFAGSQRERIAGLDDVAARLATLGDQLERDAAVRSEATVGRLDRAADELARALREAGQLDDRVRRGIDAAVGAARAMVGEEVAAVRREFDTAVAEVRGAGRRIDDVADAVHGLQSELQNWLSARDRRAEAERERVVAEVVDRFAAGLSRRDARRLAGLVPESRRQPPPSPPPPSPPPADALAEPDDDVDRRTCERCGFVAKTPAGLGAHRRSHR